MKESTLAESTYYGLETVLLSSSMIYLSSATPLQFKMEFPVPYPYCH
ncbi:MAG: hypothetical protein R6V01_03010 [Thermoplasmatota archaeon]